MRRSNSTLIGGGGGFGGFGNYISTPRVIWNKKRQQQQQQQHQAFLQKDDSTSSFSAMCQTVGPKRGDNSHLPPLPHSASSMPAVSRTIHSNRGSGPPRQEQQRLIKSVQIFLRERSAG
jgi:hypothetical protein